MRWADRLVATLLALGVLAAAGSVVAQTTAVQAGGTELSIQSIVQLLIEASFPLIGAVATALIHHWVKNQQMATLLGNAVQNSLGVLQQKASASAGKLTLDVGDPAVKAAIEYIGRHAEEALKHFKMQTADKATQDKLAEKIIARLGLAAIATNFAETSSPQAVVAGPLHPVDLAGIVQSPRT